MARQFTRASSHYLERAEAVVSAAPLTMACWAFRDEAVEMTPLAIASSASNGDYFWLDLNGSGQVSALTGDSGGTSVAETAGGFSGWGHAAAVFTSSTLRAAFVNGGSKATNTVSRSPTGLNRTAIGRLSRLSPILYYGGRIAEVGIWSVALTDDEIASLGGGASPLLVRPQSLVSYWPLIGNDSPEPDRARNAGPMTLVGPPTKGDHPRIFYPDF